MRGEAIIINKGTTELGGGLIGAEQPHLRPMLIGRTRGSAFGRIIGLVGPIIWSVLWGIVRVRFVEYCLKKDLPEQVFMTDILS